MYGSGEGGGSDGTELSIGVVIPTLNEERLIEQTVASCGHGVGGCYEVIVADGGSSDKTLETAAAAGARTVSAARGRARQMNAGAAIAKSDVLVFLHADTTLPSDFVRAIRRALLDPGMVGGAFSMEVDGPGPLMRAISQLSTFRSRCLRLPYGDQAIFVRRNAFSHLGGYADIPLLEDAELCRRLKNLGRLCILPERVTTSARRWKAEGPIRVILRNWGIGLAYACGVSPAALARLYGPPVR
jgi:rSAM/selenodomain-associated transferase 2